MSERGSISDLDLDVESLVTDVPVGSAVAMAMSRGTCLRGVSFGVNSRGGSVVVMGTVIVSFFWGDCLAYW